jgi:hypothetical protein
MNTCWNCGRALPEQAERFCTHCGAPVASDAPDLPWAINRSERRWQLVTAVCALAVVAALAIVTVIMLHNGPAATNSSQPSIEPTDDTSTVATTTDSYPNSDSSTPDATSDTDPAAVVEQYYDAINQQDYQTAWNLGGDNINSDYTSFVNGFQDTASVNLTISGVNGDTVYVSLQSQQTDGTTTYYSGTYTVDDGTIQSGSLQQSNGP